VTVTAIGDNANTERYPSLRCPVTSDAPSTGRR
jgi:hypothetical protein